MAENNDKPRLDSDISLKEKYQSLSSKGKIQFIFDYYKFPIIAFLVIAIVISSLIYTITSNKDTYCNITYYNTAMDSNELINLQAELNDKLRLTDTKSTVLVDRMYLNEDSTYGDDTSSTKAFMTKLGAKALDLLIINQSYLDNFSVSGMLVDLDSIEGFNSLNIDDNSLIKAKDENGNEHIYGINASSLNMLKDINFPSNDAIIAVAIDSQRMDHIINVLKVLSQ